MTVNPDQEIYLSLITDQFGYLKCGCLGSQREHTCVDDFSAEKEDDISKEEFELAQEEYELSPEGRGEKYDGDDPSTHPIGCDCIFCIPGA